MKRRELKILGLSYSQSQLGSYVIVLAEKKGNRKLPLIIKPSDAQRIAIEIEGIKPPRPLTHDLFKSINDSYGIDIQEVYIYAILEGIFYTKLVTSNGIEEVEIECTAGDGIAISIVFDCPLYVSKEVLDISGVNVSDDGNNINNLEIEDIDDYIEEEEEIPKRVVSIEDLEHMIEDAIGNEEYEIAAEIRDRIEKLKKENN